MDQGLRPEERIRKKSDFSFLYKNGCRCRGRYLNFVYLSNDLSHSRLGVVASRKVGNAIERNRVKRRLRDFYRRNKGLLKEAMDVVIIARPGSADLSGSDLRAIVLETLTSLEPRKRTR